MAIIVVGGDELSRAGCKSFLDDLCELETLDVSLGLNNFHRALEQNVVHWVIVLGWSINIDEIAGHVRASRDPAPNMILITPPNTAEYDFHYCRKSVELGFEGTLSAESDPSILRALLTSAADLAPTGRRDAADRVRNGESGGDGANVQLPLPAPSLAANLN